MSEIILPFVRKTYEILSDESNKNIVSWSPSGRSFVVWDTTEFAERVLPRYFKHKNFCSFVRQLNTYGFAKADTKAWEFAHEAFVQGSPESLRLITRRKAPKREPAAAAAPIGQASPDVTEALKEAEAARASASRAAALNQNLMAQLQAETARANSLNDRLASFQQLCTGLVNDVTEGRVQFANPDFEKNFLQNLVGLMMPLGGAGQDPPPSYVGPHTPAPVGAGLSWEDPAPTTPLTVPTTPAGSVAMEDVFSTASYSPEDSSLDFSQTGPFSPADYSQFAPFADLKFDELQQTSSDMQFFLEGAQQ